MALQTNLAKKDRITIAVILFAGVIFMFIWFLIKPTISSIITLNDKIEEAEIKQTENKNKIMYLRSAEDLYAKAVNDLNESTVDFYEIMDSSEIDRMVTSYVLKKGLFSENLLINMSNEPVNESPYIYADIDNSTYEIPSANGGTDTLLTPYITARSNATSTGSSGVQRVALTLVVTGSRQTCQAFIDDISTKPAVRVTGFEWGKVEYIEVYNEETGRYEQKNSGKVRLRISFNLYMAEIADYEIAG